MNATIEDNNIKLGIFFGLSIISVSFIVYGKLKLKNGTNKNTDKLLKGIHQLRERLTMATIGRRSNPLMRLIEKVTGSLVLSCEMAEGECRGGDELHTSPFTRTRATTAEAGSQVCEEIILKRERRSKVRGENENENECDKISREGFIQEMFDSSDPWSEHGKSSSSATDAENVLSEDAKLSHVYTCSVCLEELSLENTNITTTGCGHRFHLSCLLKSLSQKNLCPMCRGELEDERTKQMPSNILTPISAEQIITEEISYFPIASNIQSITLSRHPRRVAKEMLRVFGFAILRNVAEYIHDENLPAGWYDDGESGSDTESDGDGEDNEDNGEDNEDSEDNGEYNEDDGEEGGDQEDVGENRDIMPPLYHRPVVREDVYENIGW
jgi:hypothetical protein